MVKQDIRENLTLAFDTLRTHKMRSLLAVLGVVIGVGVIIVVASLITGFRATISEEIAGFGADTAWVARYDEGPRMSRLPANERNRPPLTLDQGLGLLSQCPAIKEVTISLYQWKDDHIATYNRNQVDALDMSGTSPSYMEVYGNANLQAGRFFTDAENDERAKVVVFGTDAAKALFVNPQDAVGKTVRLDGSDFRVIGVFETPKGGFGFDNEDKRAIVPYNTLHEMYPQALDNGYRFVAYPGQLDEAVDEARGVLRRERKVAYNAPDSFSITTQVQQEEQFNQIIGGVALVLIVLSSIGLLIGGVGVMNIMLVSVTERTREIGVRKAIGARSRDITWQFLFEAMTLTGAGGLFGVALFSGLALLIPHITSMKASVPAWAIIVGIAVSVGIGLVFGVWPAVKAAKLDPIEALRYE
ncbi:MAG TPA: ABC transporter permease [Candidatus Acidoferrales bacterium]|nr:ABC transporter permease [Candidatus Acidoferrales bacterium]